MKKKTPSVAEMQPDELNELRKIAREFIDRLQSLDNEIDTLKEDRKELVSEYSGKLDMRTFQAAMRVVKIESDVEHKDTYDTFVEILKA